jgi:hypothetical protein
MPSRKKRGERRAEEKEFKHEKGSATTANLKMEEPCGKCGRKQI